MARVVATFMPTVTAGTRLLLISGSLRGRSTNSAALRTAQLVAPAGIVLMLDDTVGRLPHFNADDDVAPLPVVVAELRERIHDADAVMFSVPEYAGGLPGSFKNLLDWTIGDDQPRSIYDKPVAWINASPRDARYAHDSLRTVLTYAHARIVEDACAHIPVTSADIGTDGLVSGERLRDAISEAVARLVAYVSGVPTTGAEPRTY